MCVCWGGEEEGSRQAKVQLMSKRGRNHILLSFINYLYHLSPRMGNNVDCSWGDELTLLLLLLRLCGPFCCL